MSIRAFCSEQSGASRGVVIGAGVGLALAAALAFAWWNETSQTKEAAETETPAPAQEDMDEPTEEVVETPVAPEPSPTEPSNAGPSNDEPSPTEQSVATEDPQVDAEPEADTAEAPVTPAPEREQPAETVAGSETTPNAPQSGDAVAEAEDLTPIPEPEAPAIEAPSDEGIAPIFEVVRVEESGDAVIAGRAAAGGTVRVLLDGVSVAETSADASGAFVALVALDPSEDPRTLTLESVRDGEAPVVSEQTALVAPFGREEDPDSVETAALEAPQEPLPQSGPEDAPANVEPAPVATEAPAIAETPDAPQPVQQTETAALPDAAAAPQVVIVAPDGAVPQSPSAAPARPDAPETPNVVIDTISYDAEGEVILVGRAQPGNFVRLYLNNILAETATVGTAGDWRSRVTGIAAGVYTLRADETGENGRVLSRFETPFERVTRPRAIAAALQASEAEPAPVDPALAGDGNPLRAAAGIVTVQPGFTLWAIARENYGDGVQYVRVFEANKTQIRDPDLIYPGQVFSIPDQ